VILDEGAPRPLAARLRALGVDATAFPNEWKQLSNGKLLDAIEQQGFQILITNDKNIPHQQNMSKRAIAVLVLPTIRLRDILAMAPNIAAAVSMVEGGKAFLLDKSGRLTVCPAA
jgi:hypothetical protein